MNRYSYNSIKALLLFLVSFPLVDIINLFIARNLNQFGLVPRSIEHLPGILTAPWLHGNIHHMLANLSALIVLGGLAWQWGDRVFWKSTLLIVIGSGLCVWLAGRPAFHIGASGLVYGYFGFCIIGGWLSRRFVLLLISVLVVGFYGSMIWGVLPIKAGVSFEYHLAGFICGIAAARFWARNASY